MLKTLECRDKKPMKVEFDVYTPINIEFGNWDISEDKTVYWRTGDFKKSLIEIGFAQKTGEIRSITLTLCENVYKSKEWNIENIEPIKGVPVLSVDRQQNETYIDEKGILNVYITDKTVYIQFSAHEIESLIENNHVLFCLDGDDNFCGIIINDVGDDEINILEEALK
ncbi:hypothetical protein MOB18_08510 [Bacillus inaquosorum]|uniref:hypothetical protein n=1 Tax=Bacillus inaquosorum TaxID=483913 RepID=UPI00227EC371|nr:hypothetical protein [Bacillus inaquosorum]MCY7749137.1 hypothetical protein [Bacillus inaquosorum]MCY8183062.1 hypothetical protein [Bacillus inaquosorum]